jgi:hypothetical protein
MHSRERLLRSLHHQPTDRIPISTYELVGWNAQAWENQEPSYRKLMNEIRARTDCLYMANPDLTFQPLPGCEITTWQENERHFTRTLIHTERGDLEKLQRQDDQIQTVWTLRHLLREPEDIGTYLSIPYEPPAVNFAEFDAAAETLGERGLMMISWSDPICEAAELFSMEDFLVLVRTDPALAKYFLDALYERQKAQLQSILEHDVRDVVFRVCGPEYATPPYLPPELFPGVVTVYLVDICRMIRMAGGIPRIHCHGKIGRVLDQFARTDALALDPLEPPPDGDMDLAAVKKQYGRQFCLMGNLELRELENAEPQRIDQLVRQAISDAGRGGGFILMPTAAPINIPLSPRTEANYLQMIASAWKYGQLI